MCLIYFRDSAKHTGKIDFSSLSNGYQSNPDGTGIAWFNIKANQWSVWRSVSATWKQVKTRLAALDACDNVSRIVVHFRFATHGGASLENCHPFQVADNSLLFHNGIFGGIETSDDDKSDSRQVAEAMARIVANGGKLRDAWRPVKLLAGSNRLLLTLPNGKVAYAGNWTSKPDGCYSNSNCFYVPKPKYDWSKYQDNRVGFSKYGYQGTSYSSGESSDYLDRYGKPSYSPQKLLPYARSREESRYDDIKTIYDEYEDGAANFTQSDLDYLRDFEERLEREDTEEISEHNRTSDDDTITMD